MTAVSGLSPATRLRSRFRSSPPSDSYALGLVPIAIAIVMEGAWLSVIAGLIQEFALQAPVLGLPGTILFVLIGVVVARFGSRRLGGRWAATGTALVFGAAVAGLALSPAARDALIAGDPGAGLAANPGGLLAGGAMLRGFAYGGDHVAVDTVRRAVFLGIPILAVAATIGGMVTEPFRSHFLGDTAVAAVCFVTAGLLALALSALADARPMGESAVRAHPVWVGAVMVVTVAIVTLAVSTGLRGGPSIVVTLQALVAGAIPPLAVLGLITGGRAAIRRILAIMAATAFTVWFLSFATTGSGSDTQAGAGAAGAADAGTTLDRAGAIGVGGVGLVLLGLVVFLLIRAWAMRNQEATTGFVDERSRLPAGVDERPGAVSRRRKRPWSRDPRTADAAYLALVEELHDVPDVRRKASETPAEHARRVRIDQLGSATGLGLELLAADYALTVFAVRELSEAETRRAIGRWQRLRRQLLVRPPDAPRRTEGEVDDRPPNPIRRSRSF